MSFVGDSVAPDCSKTIGLIKGCAGIFLLLSLCWLLKHFCIVVVFDRGLIELYHL